MERALTRAARRAVLLAAAALSLLPGTGWSQAGDYPNRPVRLVSGYAAGGTTSLVGRLIGQRLAEQWGHQFVLDNRPGGGTLIGGEIVARSVPDGYTLMLVDSVHVLAPLLLKAPFDPIRDFTPVGTVASTELVLVVHPSLPVKTYAEFIAHAKGRPGKLQYATPAMAGAQHLATEVFNSMTGIQMNHIPYKSAGQALVALIGGEVQVYFSTIATGTPHIRAGKVRGLTVTGTARSALLPELPTFAESGLPKFYAHKRPGFGIVGPAGMPRPIVDKLSAAMARHLATPEFRDALTGLGLEPKISSPQEYMEALRAQMAWNVETIAMLKRNGVKLDF